VRQWLAIGTPESWTLCLEGNNVWGFSPRYQKTWESLKVGDTVFCYSTRPVARVIGYCTVISKQRDATPLFPLETRQMKALWPLRVSLAPKKVIPRRDWRGRGVALERKGITFQRALQRLPEWKAGQILRALDRA